MTMSSDKHLFRSELGRALNVVTASLGSKTFEIIQQEYKDVEQQFLSRCDDSDLQLETRQRVSQRIFGDAVVKNCAMADLDDYFKIATKLGFSDIDPHISITIIYCQRLAYNDRLLEAKKLSEDLLNHLNMLEETNPGTLAKDTIVQVQSILSKCQY